MTAINVKDIGERVKRLREKRGQSQRQFAATVGATDTWVRSMEQGSPVDPGIKRITAVADVCGVSLEWLVRGKGGTKR